MAITRVQLTDEAPKGELPKLAEYQNQCEERGVNINGTAFLIEEIQESRDGKWRIIRTASFICFLPAGSTASGVMSSLIERASAAQVALAVVVDTAVRFGYDLGIDDSVQAIWSYQKKTKTMSMKQVGESPEESSLSELSASPPAPSPSATGRKSRKQAPEESPPF